MYELAIYLLANLTPIFDTSPPANPLALVSADTCPYLYVCVYQIVFYLMPEKMANYLYMKLFRTEVNK